MEIVAKILNFNTNKFLEQYDLFWAFFVRFKKLTGVRLFLEIFYNSVKAMQVNKPQTDFFDVIFHVFGPF
jgi:hypothetical protein